MLPWALEGHGVLDCHTLQPLQPLEHDTRDPRALNDPVIWTNAICDPTGQSTERVHSWTQLIPQTTFDKQIKKFAAWFCPVSLHLFTAVNTAAPVARAAPAEDTAYVEPPVPSTAFPNPAILAPAALCSSQSRTCLWKVEKQREQSWKHAGWIVLSQGSGEILRNIQAVTDLILHKAPFSNRSWQAGRFWKLSAHLRSLLR